MLLARIITGESATLEGRQAVFNVIMNRAKVNYGGFGPTWIAQATAHEQFSAYPNALGPEDVTTETMIQEAIKGNVGNIVPNSLNYADPSIMSMEQTPNSWVWKALASGQGVKIGGNTFWANSDGGSPGYDPSKIWKGVAMTDTPVSNPVAPPPVPTPVKVPAVTGDVKINWGDWAAQMLEAETPIVEKLAGAGLNIALTQLPFGAILSMFIGPTVVQQYVDQALKAAEGMLTGQTLTVPASNALETMAANLINSNEPALASFLGSKLAPMIQAEISKLGL